MPSFVAAAQALQDALRGLDARTCSGEDAASGVEVLARTEKMCAAARARLAARAAECGAHRDRGFSNPTEWMARQTGGSAGRARDELELAAGLESLSDETRAALDDGELSLAEGSEIRKTEAEVPGSETEMRDEARRRGLRGVKERGRKLRQRAKDPDELARKRRQARHLRTWETEIGNGVIHAELEPHHYRKFLRRLDTEIDREQARRACECEH